MSPDREALEAALAAAPDDPTPHAAYADLLLDAGDPRGELIRLQLALDDETLPDGQRQAMTAAVADLIRQHEAEWLGPLAGFVAAANAHIFPQAEVWWRWGWVYDLTVMNLTRDLVSAAAACPTARLLRTFVGYSGSAPLTRVGLRQLLGFLARTPLGSLRLSLPGLGDPAADEVVKSGLVGRLTTLQLRNSAITDAGAEVLARCPDIGTLRLLRLEDNLLSPLGRDALARVGVAVRYGRQEFAGGSRLVPRGPS